VNGTSKGTLTFGAGSLLGTFSWAADTNLNAGDILEVVTPATTEPNIANVKICIVGIAAAPHTPM